MITENRNGLTLLRFENLAGAPGLRHAVSTRLGGVSPAPFASLNLGFGAKDLPAHSAENLRRFCEALAVPFPRTVRMRQAHTATVRVIGPDFGFPPEPPAETDALVTDLKDTPLLALSADCALTVFYDPVRSVLAVAHSGWRGAFLNIYSQVLAVMKLRFGSLPGELLAGVSPMISAANYPVKDDFVEKLRLLCPEEAARKSLVKEEGRTHFSLKELLKHQLTALGVVNYEFAHRCTFAEKELFYSRRRDGENSGRFGLLASLTAKV